MQAIAPSILSWQASEESAGSSNLSKLLMQGAQVAIQSDNKISQVQLLQSSFVLAQQCIVLLH